MPLAVAVPSVIAALGANLGDVDVVSTSLTILLHLAGKNENQVTRSNPLCFKEWLLVSGAHLKWNSDLACGARLGGRRLVCALVTVIRGFIFEWRQLWSYCVQSLLMEVLPSAVGALDTNRGDIYVVFAGLSFLAELAYFAENQVGVWWQLVC